MPNLCFLEDLRGMAQQVALPAQEIPERFRTEPGQIIPKLGSKTVVFNTQCQILSLQPTQSAAQAWQQENYPLTLSTGAPYEPFAP